MAILAILWDWAWRIAIGMVFGIIGHRLWLRIQQRRGKGWYEREN